MPTLWVVVKFRHVPPVLRMATGLLNLVHPEMSAVASSPVGTHRAEELTIALAALLVPTVHRAVIQSPSAPVRSMWQALFRPTARSSKVVWAVPILPEVVALPETTLAQSCIFMVLPTLMLLSGSPALMIETRPEKQSLELSTSLCITRVNFLRLLGVGPIQLTAILVRRQKPRAAGLTAAQQKDRLLVGELVMNPLFPPLTALLLPTA